MNIADPNDQEISPAVRQRIDEFSRELALALQRILADASDAPELQLPGDIRAKPINRTLGEITALREEQPAQPDLRRIVFRWAGSSALDFGALAV